MHGEMSCAVAKPACSNFGDGLLACLSSVQSYALEEVTRLETLVSELRAKNKCLAEQLEIALSGRGSPSNVNAKVNFEDTNATVAEGHICVTTAPMVSQVSKANPIQDVEKWQSKRSDQRSEIDSSMKKGASQATSFCSEALKAEMKASKKPVQAETQPLHDHGWAQKIAKSQLFEILSLCVILLNGLWIAVDLDYNMAATLLTADLVFVVVDNLFCLFFTFEIAVRFAALKVKSRCLRDPWFVFDSFLVVAMIVETWIVTFVLLITETSSMKGISSMSVFRILRLLRLTRMARMLRAFPEAMILVKGLTSSIRSVMVTLALLVALTYIFAIVLKLLTLDSILGDEFYKSVPFGMKTLLYETVVPDNAVMLESMLEEAWYLPLIYVIFIGLSALTLMNMIIGLLCDVVSTVSAEELEAADIARMTEKLYDAIAAVDTDFDGIVSPAEVSCMLSNKSVVEALSRVGIDVVALVQELDILVDSDGLPFDDFVEVVLKFRSAQAATIGVVAGLRKSIQNLMCQLEERISEVQKSIQTSERQLKKHMTELPRQDASATVSI